MSENTFDITCVLEELTIVNINGTELISLIDMETHQRVFFKSPATKQIWGSLEIHDFRGSLVAVLTHTDSKIKTLLFDGLTITQVLINYVKSKQTFLNFRKEIRSYAITTYLSDKFTDSPEFISIDEIPNSKRGNRLHTRCLFKNPSLRYYFFYSKNRKMKFKMKDSTYKKLLNHIKLNKGDLYVDETWHKTNDEKVFILNWLDEEIYLDCGTFGWLYLTFDEFTTGMVY